MLLGRAFGQRLEPVGDVGHTMLHGPLLHTAGDTVGRLAVEALAAFDTVEQRVEAVGIEILAHLLAVEDQFSIILGGLACRNLGRNFLFLKGFLD